MDRKVVDLRSRQRERHNKDLIRRMKRGEVLQSYDAEDSFFPPRPTIKKDLKVIKQLYTETEAKK